MWEDAIAYYAATCEAFGGFPFVLQRVVSQRIASVDSIHRNIAEGYCRRSLNEYLHFLNIALASAGESVSGLHALSAAKQIADTDFQRLDAADWGRSFLDLVAEYPLEFHPSTLPPFHPSTSGGDI